MIGNKSGLDSVVDDRAVTLGGSKRKGGIMARFYGSMWGSARNDVTRVGSGNTGVGAHVRGWRIGGKVEAFDRDGKDVLLLQVTGGSDDPSLKETPWIEVVRDPETGETTITCRPGPEGKVIKW